MKFKFLKYISKDKNEILFAQIALVVILAMAIVFIERTLKYSDWPVDDSNSIQASLLINFKDKQRLFEGEVTNDMTIIDALNASAAAGQINFRYGINQEGKVKIMRINSHANNIDGKSFVFYLNSQKINSENNRLRTSR